MSWSSTECPYTSSDMSEIETNYSLIRASFKLLRFPSPKQPNFFGKVKKKNSESIVKKQVISLKAHDLVL